MTGYYDDTPGGSPRRIAAIAAVVAVALCVAFLSGYAVRGSSRSATHRAKPPAEVRTATYPSVAAGSPEPTVPYTEPAPTTAGQLHLNSQGVIVGYNHDQAGAVAAAGNYTAAVYVQANRVHARELAVLTSIAATPADAVRMAGDFSTEDAALAQILGVADLQSDGVIAYGHPQGYRVESISAAAAVIDVYVAGGQGVADAPGDSGAAGETFYEVDQVQLVWAGDWRLKNWSHLVENDGPAMATIAAEGYRPFPIGEVRG